MLQVPFNAFSESLWPFVIVERNETDGTLKKAAKSDACVCPDVKTICEQLEPPTLPDIILDAEMTVDAVQGDPVQVGYAHIIFGGLAYIFTGGWIFCLPAHAVFAPVTLVKALLFGTLWCCRWASDFLEALQEAHGQWPWRVSVAVIATLCVLHHVFATLVTVPFRQFGHACGHAGNAKKHASQQN